MKVEQMKVREKVQRSFFIGDEWLYYKVYIGIRTADVMLSQNIKPIMNALLKGGFIKKWFFIRYADPDFHIRIRVNYDDSKNIHIITKELNKALSYFLDNGFIWKVQTDTYQRELERYGENTMDLSEEIFYHDSNMVCNFIDMMENNVLNIDAAEIENLRWLFALRAIDSFLDSFEMNDEEKIVFLGPIKDSFINEFNLTGKYKRSLDKKFRKERTKIDHFIDFEDDNHPVLKIIDHKSKSIQKIASEILEYENKGLLMLNINYLLGSHVHMMLNRIFRSKNRLHETVCYDFLFRHYRSKVARRKKNKLQYVNGTP